MDRVDKILNLVTAMDDANYCIGNPDPRFNPLVEKNGGIFKDKSGMAI